MSTTVPLDYTGTSSVHLSRVDSKTSVADTKTRKSYRISIEKGVDGWLVVTSPDLESLVTQGKTEEEAIRNAMDAMELILEEVGEEKEFNLIIKRKI